nr:ankyrin repeat-containing protein [Tanacetum cinerariifolium]
MLQHDSASVEYMHASKEELEGYMHASKVNVSEFVSVKLFGRRNYDLWKAQMLSLLDHQMIRDIVENREILLKSKSEDVAKKYDILVKGWIYRSLNGQVLRHFDYVGDAQSIRIKLKDEYCFSGYPTVGIQQVRAEDYDYDFDYGGHRGKLREATREGNWWRAQSILKKHRFKVTIKINNVDETMLHLAVGEGKNYFVQKLLNSIQNEELLEEKNNKGHTALHIAALVGNKYAAKLLVKKRDNLFTFAYLFEAAKAAAELLPTYRDSFEEFIIRLIYRKEYALAYKLYELHLMSTKLPTDKVLMEITRNFLSVGIGEELFYPSWENACQNIVERSSLLFYSFIYLYARAESTFCPSSYTLSTISVDSSLHFGASFTLVYVLFPPVEGFSNCSGAYEEYRAEKEGIRRSSFFFYVVLLAPSHKLSCTTGAALQLQRELQWREEVEKFMERIQHTELNIDNLTPGEVFTKEHRMLLRDGENWLKATASSCIITAALIVTIVFAAAITVPGGSNQETGKPLFRNQIAFNVFAISDAISLFSAATSLLVFLSIFLNARFAEKDFLLSLPRRLLIALGLLFLSATSMISAFSAILFLVFCDQRPWMLAPIGICTCMPIAAIVTLQFPLVVELYRSTYSSKFGKQKLHYSQF